VSLGYIGEGNEGDYDEDDPDDVPLCRFDLYRRFHEGADQQKVEHLCGTDSYEDGEWMEVRDGSYCTQLDARLPKKLLKQAAQFILDQVSDALKNYKHEKRLYERLSWIEIKNNKPCVS
jgi:hypothetical protein